MIQQFAIAKTAIETDLETALAVLFDVICESTPISDTRYRVILVNGVPFIFMRPDRASPFLFFDRHAVTYFTSDDFFDTPEILRPFLRGCLHAARRVWVGHKRPGLDFDRGNFFVSRPWPEQGVLQNQTIVLLASPESADQKLPTRSLLVAAVGRKDEGLPINKDLEVDLRSHEAFVAGLAAVDLTRIPATPLIDPTVTTLQSTPPRQVSPGSLSYDQWKYRLHGTAQGHFLLSDIRGPQRIDGPAGSGKTLALVLKCLSVLKDEEKAKRRHHAAFVVFSEATRRKVLESFFLPLDSQGFHLESPASAQQSVAVTTLLAWSNEEIKQVVPPYSLLTEDAAVARRDQRSLVLEVLERYLAEWKGSLGSGLSPELTAALLHLTPTLVSMFQHEFGVVIKGMADGERRKYLALKRPRIALPCSTLEDRRFLYALFEEYKKALVEYGIVDLDDVAISHLKLLQMPLRPRRGFETVFVDEAHSFNPNEIAVLSLLVRETDAPKLILSVDLPQGLGDKGYDEGGLESIMLQDVKEDDVQPFSFPSSYRCSQQILTLATSVYGEGANFYRSIRVPSSLLSDRPAVESAHQPLARGYSNAVSMMNSVVTEADKMVSSLRCKRSDVLIVLLYDELFELIPPSLRSVSTTLLKKTDVEQETAARRAKHFVLSRAEHLHGLEYEGVLLVGASHGEVPRSDPFKDRGATAIYEIQQVVDKLYLAITRARRQVVVLYDRQPSFLLREAIRSGLLQEAQTA